MHIPDDPQYYEKFYFTPGDLGFKSFKTKKGNLGTLICWDQWFHEAARLTALKGAEILFYPTAIGWHPSEKKKFGKSQLESWLTVQRSHAIANGVYVAAINRVGIEKQDSKKLEFWGNSVVFDPNGKIIKKGNLSEQVLVCDIDLKKIDNIRRHWPFFRDRRIDLIRTFLKIQQMTKFSNSEDLLMPAEWEKQKSTWIAWPHNKKDWPSKFDHIPEVFAEIIFYISKVQTVNILIQNSLLKKKATLVLKNLKLTFLTLNLHYAKPTEFG